jgi:adenosylhomocysteinase
MSFWKNIRSIMQVDWLKKEMPVLNKLSDDYIGILEGVRIGACLHITKETAMLLMALKKCGASVFACASNPLSTQNNVAEYLRDHGIMVFAEKGETMEQYKANLNKVLDQHPEVIIDDGADLITLLHTERQEQAKEIKWAQEETTTGVQRVRAIKNLLFPVILVNESPTKNLFDNVYGTGQSTIDGIIRATNILIAGKTFVVAGYGHCGKGLAQRARGMGANVIVTEIDPIKALQAVMDGFRVMLMDRAVYEADIVVTVTGNINVIDKRHFDLFKPGVILANSGHFDVEINVKELEKFDKELVSRDLTCYNINGKKVYLLDEGRLVNLAAAEGHPSSVMDMSFSNQLLACVIDKGQMENKIYNLPEYVDIRVAQAKLESLGIKIDLITVEQSEYINKCE